MKGMLIMDRLWSAPLSWTPGYAPWTRPSFLSAQYVAPSRRVTPTAQPAFLCPPERRHDFQGWDTAHVRRSVQVLHPDDDTSALGAPFDSSTSARRSSRRLSPAVSCDRPFCRWIMLPPKSYSPASAQTSPNSLATCGKMVIRWTTLCWPCSTPNSILPSARP